MERTRERAGKRTRDRTGKRPRARTWEKGWERTKWGRVREKRTRDRTRGKAVGGRTAEGLGLGTRKGLWGRGLGKALGNEAGKDVRRGASTISDIHSGGPTWKEHGKTKED